MFLSGVALGVVGVDNPSGILEVDALLDEDEVLARFGANWMPPPPSSRMPSFVGSGVLYFINGFRTSLATFNMTSYVDACSAVGSR